jgi:hypothetical protein
MTALLPEEELIVQSDDKMLLLTNMRIIVQKRFTSSYVFLEEIGSIEVSYFGDLYYLLASIIVVYTLEHFLLFTEDDSFIIITHIISCAVIILLWWIYHRVVILVRTKNGKKTDIMVAKSAYGKIPDFVNKIQLERDKRIKSLTLTR